VLAMAWFTLCIGGIVLLAGLCGQCFGIKRKAPGHPSDKFVGKMVLTIGSTVVGLWLVAFSVVHLIHLHSVGRW